MKIIALHGKGGCGKSSVLRYLYSLLTGDFDFTQFYFYKENDFGDISAMFAYKDKKLGLTTLGDSESDLIRPFNEFKKEHCDLIVCACRSRDTKNGANNYIKSQSKVITWIKKAYIETWSAKYSWATIYNELNMLQAKALKEEIISQL